MNIVNSDCKEKILFTEKNICQKLPNYLETHDKF